MSASYARPDFEFNYYVLAGLILSLAIHLGAVLFINPLEAPHGQSPLVVDVFYSPPAQIPSQNLEAQSAKNQLVSPPEASSEPKPLEHPKTALLSDRDSYAKREQVRRGDALEAGPSTLPARAAREKQAERKSSAAFKEIEKKPPVPASKSQEDRELKELKLDDSTLASEFGIKKAAAPKSPRTLDELVGNTSSSNINMARNNYQAFSRPSGSGAAFLGIGGTSDYLPHLPDGDITLLNTKATLYAVFVRRVATQVFSQLRSQGWGALSPSSIRAISNFARVRATLGPDGSFRKVELLGSSGSPRFDEVLQAAAKSGSIDPNPPKQALAEDGNYHFIFEARSWVQIGPGPAGFPAERRWLLLSTGLE